MPTYCRTSVHVVLANAWDGDYYDGQTGRRHPAEVFLGPAELQIRLPDGTCLAWRYADVRQTQGRFRGEPVTLEHGSPIPELLVVRQAAFLQALRRAARELGQRFEGPLGSPRWLMRIVIGTGGSIVLVIALFQIGLPAFSDFLSRFVPVTWERMMGRQAFTHLAPEATRCTNPTLQTNLNILVTRLTAPLSGRYEYEVVVADAQWFNAFAAPGGYIVVFRPLLQATASVDELAAVLAHEMQHIERRHATRAMIRQFSMGAIVSAIAGQLTGLSPIGGQVGQAVLALGYSREAEEEADREAVHLLQESGMGADGMIQFFGKMKARGTRSHLPEYLSTHPDTGTRLERLKSLAQATQAATHRLHLSQPWENLATLCR
jgi:Zn-dependent protease with chaperone function